MTSTPYAPAPVATSQSRSTDILIETARNLGIQTEGKTMDQISKEIVEVSQKKD